MEEAPKNVPTIWIFNTRISHMRLNCLKMALYGYVDIQVNYKIKQLEVSTKVSILFSRRRVLR